MSLDEDPQRREAPLNTTLRLSRLGRARSRLLLGAWALATAALTLSPGGEVERTVPFLCLPCGERGSADALLNMVLFAPPGVALASLGVGVGGVAVVAALTSTGIEVAQTALPGRFPTAADVLFNTLGAVGGALLWMGLWRRTFTTVGVSSAVLGGLVATAWLAGPTAPAGDLYGQYTPDLGGFDRYRGSVVSAAVGEVAVGPGRLDDPEPLRRALRSQEPLSVRFVPGEGERAARWAPVFAVFSADRALGTMTAARGDDVMVRRRMRSTDLRFQSPAAVFRGALVGGRPGEPVELRATYRATSVCLAVDERAECGSGVDPTDGWRFLIGGPSWSRTLQATLSVLWLGAGLGAVLLAPGSFRARAIGFAAVLLTVGVLPWVSALGHATWGGVAGGVAVAMAGAWTVAGLRRSTATLGAPEGGSGS